MKNKRDAFEAAVIERMKDSGFLEAQIRTECLVRSGDDYQDELINYGWWAWQAASLNQDANTYPCYIIEADFEKNTVTLQMTGNYSVSAGPKVLSDAASEG